MIVKLVLSVMLYGTTKLYHKKLHLKYCTSGNGWVVYQNVEKNAYIDISMAHCGFIDTPYIVSSIHGSSKSLGIQRWIFYLPFQKRILSGE